MRCLFIAVSSLVMILGACGGVDPVPDNVGTDSVWGHRQPSMDTLRGGG